MQARITRAKKTLAAAQVPFEVPPPEERRERLGSVLSVIYLIFTEGSSRHVGRRLDPHRPGPRGDPAGPGARPAGARRARGARPARPARADRRAVPGARRATTATPVLLEDQDRRRWDRAAIRRGRAALAAAGPVGRGLGAYGLQASIAECHAVAPSVEDTDWERIVLLYEALGRLAPSPVVELNRAVAVSMASGPAAALPLVDELVERGRPGRLAPAARRPRRAAHPARPHRRGPGRARGRRTAVSRASGSATYSSRSSTPSEQGDPSPGAGVDSLVSGWLARLHDPSAARPAARGPRGDAPLEAVPVGAGAGRAAGHPDLGRGLRVPGADPEAPGAHLRRPPGRPLHGYDAGVVAVALAGALRRADRGGDPVPARERRPLTGPRLPRRRRPAGRSGADRDRPGGRWPR